MDLQEIALFARHDNLLTRAQARGGGLHEIAIDEAVRRGRWIAIRRGVYALRSFWQRLDPRGVALYQARAASAAMTRPHAMSHDSAALEHGMAFWVPTPSLVHVTRPDVRGTRTEHGVKHHLAPYPPKALVRIHGRPVLDAARTAVDLAREHGVATGITACDSALRAGVSRAELEAVVAGMRCWPHVTWAREAVDLADPGAENLAESLARILVLELGIGRPETQFGLTDGHRTVWCDLRVGRHIFEMDGEVKYIPVGEGGVATRPAREVLRAEKQRQDFVTGFKLGVSRIVWADLWGARREQTRLRLLREYHDTVARFGTSVADLDRYRPTRRRAS